MASKADAALLVRLLREEQKREQRYMEQQRKR